MGVNQIITLTKKQRVDLFAMSIVEGSTQSDAYRKAYPSSLTWLNKTVHEKASAFAKDGKVLARVNELKEAQLIKHSATIEKVMEKLSYVAFFNPRDLFNEDRTIRALHELPREVAAALSVVMDEDGKVKSFQHKVSDAIRALLMLGNFFQMWTSNIVHTGKDGGQIKTETTVITKEMTLEEATRIYREHMSAD